MIRDCRRCGGPLESDVASNSAGVPREVLACRCGWQEDAPRVPLTVEEVRRRIAVVRAYVLAESEPVGHLAPGEVG